MPVQQNVPLSERIKNFRNPCGYGCSLCCSIYSIWGILMLIVIAILTENGYRGIDGDVPSIGDTHKAATGTYIAAAIYGFFLLISLLRIAHLFWLSKQKKASPNMDEL